MFKMQIVKSWKKENQKNRKKYKDTRKTRKYIWFFIIILWIILLWIKTPSKTFALNIGFDFSEKLTNTYNRLTQENPIKKLAGTTATPDLFTTIIENIDQEKIEEINFSIQKTTNFINEKYSCDIKQKEIAQLLYEQNTDFTAEMKELVLKWKDPRDDAKKTFTICKKIEVCKEPNIRRTDRRRRESKETINNCINETNNKYKEIVKNRNTIEGIDNDLKGKELFWNNDLKDSNYDIISDINEVSKLFFDNPPPPEQKITFFKMPMLGPPPSNWDSSDNEKKEWNENNNNKNNDDNNDDDNNDDNYTKDWRTQTTKDKLIEQKEIDIKDKEEILKIKSENIESIENIENIKNNESTKNKTTEAKLSFQKRNNWIGNQCRKIDTENTPLSNDITQERTKTDNKEEKQNQEENTIPEKKEKQEQGKDKTTNKDNKTTTWNNTSTSTNNPKNPKDPETVELDIKNSQKIKSCIKKCDAYGLSEKAICIAKCSCITYEGDYSKYIGANRNGEWVFKVKVCMVPPKNKPSPKQQAVYSIEQIINGIEGTLSKLRNSGQLNVNKKTHEALDTSNANLNISKQMKISLSKEEKPTQSNKSEYTKLTEKKEEHKNIKQQYLNFSPNMKSKKETNKYIVLANKWIMDAKESIVNSPKELKKIAKDINDTERLTKQENNEKKERNTTNQNLNEKKNNIIARFLNENRNFWITTKEEMKQFHAITKLLNQK